MQHLVFHSHNRKDKPFARRLAADLQRSGATVWLDAEQLEPGDSALEGIQSAIDSSEYLAVVLSPDSVRSRWVNHELERAMQRQIDFGRIMVLPLLYRDCEIPSFLTGKVYADFREDAHYKISLNQLKRKIGLTLTMSSQQIEEMENQQTSTALSNLQSDIKLLAGEHPELRGKLEHLSNSADYVLRLHRQFIVQSAFREGTYELDLKPLHHLSDFVRRLLVEGARQNNARNNQITWRLHSGKSVPTISVDHTLIELALGNLIDNAFKYSHQTSTVHVNFRVDDARLCVEVSNDGPVAGEIAAQDIFEEGFHGAQLIRRAPRLDQGLYTSKLVAAAHGGEVSYQFDRDSISTFILSLPF